MKKQRKIRKRTKRQKKDDDDDDNISSSNKRDRWSKSWEKQSVIIFQRRINISDNKK